MAYGFTARGNSPPTGWCDIDETAPLNVPTRLDLFMGFLGLGLMGFGGVLPLSRRMLVEKRQWVSAAEFTELLAICQILPGGNICNLAVAVGMRFYGVSGAMAALVGLVAVPTVALIALGTVYDRYHAIPAVQHAFAGLSATASGLLVAMAFKMAKPLRAKRIDAGIAVATFAVVGVIQAPLLWVMGVAIPLSVWVMARKR